MRLLPTMALEPPARYVAFVAAHLDPLREQAVGVAGEDEAQRLYPEVLTDVATRWRWLELRPKPARKQPKATTSGPRKIQYYRNPMGLPDTSPVPKKDSMGMDYIPVYADEDQDSGNIEEHPHPGHERFHSHRLNRRARGAFAHPATAPRRHVRPPALAARRAPGGWPPRPHPPRMRPA